MPDSPIDHVSDTAFWVAHHRARETARRDALFRDPFAARLAGERGRQIAARMPMSAMTGWVVTMRTCMIDRFIAQAVAGGVDAIVNLGAGLDARPFRMHLPGSLLWVDADFPAVIAYKEKILSQETPHCRLQWAKVNLSDATERQKFLSRINTEAKKILVLTEGVIPYLSEADVGGLATDLHSFKNIRYWIADYSSREAFERRKKSAMAQKLTSAPMLFNPRDWFEFFSSHGWRVAEMGYYADEARHSHRPIPLPLIPRLIIKLTSPFTPRHVLENFRKSAGFALLEAG